MLPLLAYITCESSAEGVKDALQRMPAEWKTMKFRQKLSSHMREKWSKEAYINRLECLMEKQRVQS
jgi:hypothetical protein